MNIRSKFLTLTTTTLLVLFAGSVPADDTDIFYGPSTVPVGTEPIVMFSLDWRPNLGAEACGGGECATLIAEGFMSATGPYTYFDLLRGVLRKVMDPLEGLKVGLMLNHDYKNNCANNVIPRCSDGGYIALAAKSFRAGDANGAKAAFHKLLDDIPTPQGNASHKYQGAELFFELYRYLTGQRIWNGHVGFLDYSSDQDINLDVDNPLIAWDADAESGANYQTPLTAGDKCTKAFTVNLMFQVSQQDADSADEMARPIAAGGMNTNNTDFPDVIELLNDIDLADGLHGVVPDLDGIQNVTSYFLVDPDKINATTTGYAQAGGTGAPLGLDSDPDKLVKTLSEVFKQILAVSTTFVAASVPVNVFNRAEVVDNIYLAVFQADEKTRPYWPGNVKKLKVTGLGVNPQIVDVNGDPAIGADGRIAYEALTHWTDASALPPADPNLGEVAGRDGRSVRRGSAGQKIPGFISGSPGGLNSDAGARQLFFDDGGALSPLNVDAGTATTLQASLGAVDAAESAALIAYARGLDIDDLDGDGDRTEPREWIMSDPLHSRPLPLNFGTRGGYSATNPAIYIAIASNDGFMRLIRNTTAGGAESGAEVWGFMPQSVMDEVKTLRTNAAGIRHPYLTDGTPVAYLEDTNINGTIDAGEAAYLYFGLRRGDRNLYALNISDPENPALLWSIDKSGDFAELGYTFSTPRVIKVDTGSGPIPALIFGGGYDMNKDSGGIGTDDSEGNAIFVINAKTGALIWKAVKGASTGPASAKVYEHVALTDSIPSTVSLLDSDGDTLHDRAYVGDTGGNVWRADLVGTDTSKWTLSLLATVGRHSSGFSGKADDRRFFHRPDIVQHFDQTGPFDAVLIGAGDRADPLDNAGATSNWFYMIKDRAFKPGTGSDTGQTHSSFGDVTNTCQLDDGACTADLSNGWALELTTGGEKSLSTATTLGGTVYFSTYLPPGASSAGACGPSEGNGRLYAVSLNDAHARNNYDTTTDDEERFEELDSEGIPAEVVTLPPNSILRPDLEIEKTSAPTRVQTYWFESEDSDL